MSGELFNLDGFPGYRVELRAGGAVLAQDDNSLADAIAEGQFTTSTVEMTTGSDHPQLGQPLSIRLVNLNEIDSEFPDADLEVDFDNVRLTANAVCAADTDDDGIVGLSDLLAVISCWGSVATEQCAASDIDASGSIGLGDLLAVISGWGACEQAHHRVRSRWAI